jgi:hypothetical protein
LHLGFFCPCRLDWTDKSLTRTIVLIQCLSLLNHFENTDELNMNNHQWIPACFSSKSAAWIFLSTLLVCMSSCISVQVPFGPAGKAEKAVVAPPAVPFAPFASSTADEAWASEQTGNTISYLSECKKTDEKIEDAAYDAAKAVENGRIISKSRSVIDSKPSYDLVVLGKVENQAVKMAISVFRSGDCTFSLTYGGIDSKFESELNLFHNFKKGFHAP